MPDPFQYTLALVTAFAVSFLTIVGTRGFSRWRVCRTVGILEMIAVVAGMVASYRVLHFEWDWSPANAICRFLTIVLPVAIIVELIFGLRANLTNPEVRHFRNAGFFSCVAMGLRLGLFALLGRILLHNSVYLRVTAGVDATWSEWTMFGRLAASAVALTAMWLVLSSLAKRDEPASIITSLSLSILTAGISIMLAGYIRGGAAGFPVAASLMGVVMATVMFQPEVSVLKSGSLQSLIGFGITVLFSLLWIGSLFGQLPAIDATIIFLAPSLCWVSELTVFRRLKGLRKAAIRLIAVAIPLTLQLLSAKRSFDQKLGTLVAVAAESMLGI